MHYLEFILYPPCIVTADKIMAFVMEEKMLTPTTKSHVDVNMSGDRRGGDPL